MNSGLKFVNLKMLIIVFCFFAATPIFAQDLMAECQGIYNEFLANRRGPEIEKYKKAISDGEKYLEKCGEIHPGSNVNNYVTNQLRKLKEIISPCSTYQLEAHFNDSLKNNNLDELIATAKELIGCNRPYSLDLMLDIASIGFDQASAKPPVDKYNEDALKYAKMALQKMSDGQKSGNTEKYGFYAEYKTKECPDGKINATGWMNYIIGYILSVRQKQTKEALPYLYQATQNGCETLKLVEPYRLIGDWYFNEVRLGNSQKTISSQQKVYAEGALDAYTRAYHFSPPHPNDPTYKNSLFKKVKELYALLYGNSDGFYSYIKNVTNILFNDPTTPFNSTPNDNQK